MTKNLVSNSTRFLMLVVFCFVLSIGQAFAQAESSTGQITGVVTDANGAVVPNASITITNKGTNQTQTATTNNDGVYRFVLLQPGEYTVKASSTGFGEQKADVQVQVGRTLDANFALGAAGAQAEVTVTSDGIQTTTSNSDAVINETAINNLPINGRRFQDFATLTPTAQVEGSRGQISLAGQRGINGNVNVDGVDFNQPFFGGIRGGERSNQAFTIPQEAIKEFQVVASGYTAEFGRSTGGIINAVTKSGSNDYHGSLFYLLRPERLARGNEYIDALQSQRLNALGLKASVAPTQKQFGGSIGGRIVRDKLFFFGSYEQQQFTANRQVLIASLTTIATPTDRGLEAFNYLRTLETPYVQENDAKAVLGRIDWNVNNSNRFNVRYSISRNNAPNAAATGETVLDPTTNNAVSSNGLEKDRTKIGVAQLITNFGTATVNELRLQYAREDRPREANVLAPNVFFGANFAQYGSRNFLPTTQFDTRYQVADAVTYVAGNHTAKFGGEFSRIFANQTFGFNQFGAYTLSTGGTATILRNVSSTRDTTTTPATPYLGRFDDANANYQRQIGNLQTDVLNKELAFFAQDSYRVTPNLSFNYGLRVEQQYNPEADTSNTAIVNVVRNTIFPFRGKSFDPGQVPDSGWQFGPRFGFAYDFMGDGKTVLRGYAGVYYARTPGLIFADTTNNYRATPGNVSTRVPITGFSQATFNTFVASAAGAQYRAITGCDPTVTPIQPACVPNTLYRQFAIVGVNLNSFALNALPNVTPDQIGAISSALGLSANPFVGATVTGHDENFKNPRSYQFGFAVEREVQKNLVVGLDYTYVKTDRLQRNRDLNIPGPLTGSQYVEFLRSNNTLANFNTMVSTGIIDQILQSGRTYIAVVTPSGFVNPTTGAAINFPTGSVTTRARPTNDPALNPNAANRLALGPVQVRESTARSLYQGLTLRMRLTRKWGQVNAYYTLSSNLSDDDNERDSGGVAYANPYDMTNEYGPSRLDRKHIFVANPVFFLPFGFEASSAIRFRSGTPINAYAGADLNGDNTFNDRPIFGFGEINRNYFRNNAIYDVDVRGQKRFKFSEKTGLVLSVEIFNVLNKPNIIFQFPGTNGTSGTLGQYCTVGSQLCGLNGATNVNFLQVRDQVSTSPTFGQINLNTNPGSQAFQMQLGARFQF